MAEVTAWEKKNNETHSWLMQEIYKQLCLSGGSNWEKEWKEKGGGIRRGQPRMPYWLHLKMFTFFPPWAVFCWGPISNLSNCRNTGIAAQPCNSLTLVPSPTPPSTHCLPTVNTLLNYLFWISQVHSYLILALSTYHCAGKMLGAQKICINWLLERLFRSAHVFLL